MSAAPWVCAAALRAYQDADYETIRARFEAAGIPVTDSTSPGASDDPPPSAGASGLRSKNYYRLVGGPCCGRL